MIRSQHRSTRAQKQRATRGRAHMFREAGSQAGGTAAERADLDETRGSYANTGLRKMLLEMAVTGTRVSNTS